MQEAEPVRAHAAGSIPPPLEGAELDEELRSLRQRLAERTLQLETSEAKQRETASAAGQSELLAVMSHDLRSPLAAILGYAELLAMGVPESIPDRSLECVHRIRAAARRLQALLDEMSERQPPEATQ